MRVGTAPSADASTPSLFATRIPPVLSNEVALTHKKVQRHIKHAVDCYESSSEWSLYEAVRASTAAPTLIPFFQKHPRFKRDTEAAKATSGPHCEYNQPTELNNEMTFQAAVQDPDVVAYVDGGLVANNPAVFAIAEATKLFPGRAIQCL